MNNELLDSYAEAYQASFDYSLDNQILLNHCAENILNLANRNSALDLGLGHGHTAKKFSCHFSNYKILEGSNLVIKQFRDNNPDFKGEIIHTFFEEFESTERFDTILMTFILEHVEDPLNLLNKYKNFLKPNGSIFIAVPNYEALNKRLALEAGLIKEMNVLSPADKQLGHQRLYSVNSLLETLGQAGLKASQLLGIYLKPFTTAQIASLNLSKDILEAMGRLGKDYPELSVGILVKAELDE